MSVSMKIPTGVTRCFFTQNADSNVDESLSFSKARSSDSVYILKFSGNRSHKWLSSVKRFEIPTADNLLYF